MDLSCFGVFFRFPDAKADRSELFDSHGAPPTPPPKKTPSILFRLRTPGKFSEKKTSVVKMFFFFTHHIYISHGYVNVMHNVHTHKGI